MSYGLQGSGLYVATNCVVSAVGSTIDCQTVTGIGAGHSWIVTLRGQSSGYFSGPTITTSYGLPTVSGFLTGNPMATQGAVQVSQVGLCNCYQTVALSSPYISSTSGWYGPTPPSLPGSARQQSCFPIPTVALSTHTPAPGTVPCTKFTVSTRRFPARRQRKPVIVWPSLTHVCCPHAPCHACEGG